MRSSLVIVGGILALLFCVGDVSEAKETAARWQCHYANRGRACGATGGGFEVYSSADVDAIQTVLRNENQQHQQQLTALKKEFELQTATFRADIKRLSDANDALTHRLDQLEAKVKK
jgi:hypothetical protein